MKKINKGVPLRTPLDIDKDIDQDKEIILPSLQKTY